MTVSVVFEVIGEVLRFATTQLAAQGADTGLLAALHETWRSLFFPVGAALGAAILASSVGMLMSREFPRWVSLWGVLTGSFWIGIAFYMALNNAIIGPLTGPAWLAWVFWLLATAVTLFRRAGPITLRRPVSGSAS